MTHKIKILEHFADAVVSGDKTFEVRKNDRNYQRGDRVKFMAIGQGITVDFPVKHPVDEKMYEITYDFPVKHPINEKMYEITYVLKGWGIEEGYCVFGIKEVQE